MGDGVRAARVWRAVLGVEHTVIEGVDLEQVGNRGSAGSWGPADPVPAEPMRAVWAPRARL